MSALKAVWKQGRVVLQGPADWPEGCRLIVQEDILSPIEFMTEDEQGDDPAAIQGWIDELREIPPAPADDPEWDAWENAMRLHNIEAVRQQFQDDQS
ncbi:MAG: hypothetical protein KY475_18315 [Planctomycetes bacterium]|nr:hypothetical protein [Planctomycetota bacterium]